MSEKGSGVSVTQPFVNLDTEEHLYLSQGDLGLLELSWQEDTVSLWGSEEKSSRREMA